MIENIKVLKVSEFNDLVKNNLESDNKFKSINIKGEIANLTHNKTGHIYFSIKDLEAKIDCAIWKTNAYKLINLNVTEGTEVIVSGSISFYKPTGKITFIVYDIKIDGVGELAIIYEKRFNELKSKGWFNKENKKPITNYPKNIGIVTAATGDAIKDLITTIKRRYPIVNIYVFPAMVQGESSSKDIAKKIRQANNFKIKLDTLIIGRGGGSYEDLWSFNEMDVLTEIYNSNIPIISGIGHEPDITLSDYVADVRSSTPTAAGERSTPDFRNLIKLLDNKLNEFGKKVISLISNNRLFLSSLHKNIEANLNSKIYNQNLFLNNSSHNIKNVIRNKMHNENNKLSEISKNFHSNLFYRLASYKQNLDENLNNFKISLTSKLNLEKTKLEELDNLIKLHNPDFILKKGYAIIRNTDNNIIRSIVDLNNIDIINVTMVDGDKKLKLKKE
ncbi:exodeoxyribonuclease VII large subunit [Spiroplasma litorale]|uniref:Exodeoxyribonuclease 7 large subunit n=1 Tax=Spiroplasma litorale TaxID=216942 RepID=A0A0K1W1R8_9MOLU|nr:exodeoxyribonuclease VII large subunit [Spiroplasma litorale]AKX34136.1 exodeoxyribonuclease VII large subunit [Spiroplasma litorale]